MGAASRGVAVDLMIGAGVTRFERWIVRPIVVVLLLGPFEVLNTLRRWRRKITPAQ